MYATRNGESRPVTRHQTKETLHTLVGVLWCPFCDTSNQDDRDQCGGCDAVFTLDADYGGDLTAYTLEDSLVMLPQVEMLGPIDPEMARAVLEGLPEGTIEIASDAIIYEDATGGVIVGPRHESYHTPETEPAADPEPNACPDCSKVLKSPAGVKVHQRQAHK